MTLTHNQIRGLLSIPAVVICLLTLSGCNNLTTVLDAVLVATDAAPGAVIALEATGTITPAIGNQILDIAQTVNQDTGLALTEAASGDSAQKMAVVIAQDYSNVPQMIPGLPPAATAIISGILTAVDAVLIAVGAQATHGTTVTGQKVLTPNAMKMGKDKVQAAQIKVNEIKAKIQAARK